MKKHSLNLFKEWIRKAQNDLRSAEILFKENGPTDSLCFHCQQAAEKYLKSFLVSHWIKPPMIHDLVLLLKYCRKIDKEFENLKEEVLFLNKYYIETRYPPEISVYSRRECKDALKKTEVIVKFIVDKVL